MWIDYPTVIGESEDELAAQEWRLRGTRQHVRLQMLRLLKCGQARSLAGCAPLLGYSVPQLSRWWQRYKEAGLEGLIAAKARLGKTSRLTSAAWAGMEEELRAGRIGRLEDARSYLHERWEIDYQSVQGVWWQFKRRRVKLKTGRRRHRRAAAEEQAAFKKTLVRS